MQNKLTNLAGMSVALDRSKASPRSEPRRASGLVRHWVPIALALAWSCAWGGASPAFAGPVASDWVEGHNVRTRLIAGIGDVSLGRLTFSEQLVAGLEMELADGWKTYWRFPGDAGGVPPEFSFEGSANVAKTGVLYPAPMRMTDRAGNTIGYKKRVVFPILVTPEKAGEAVTLKLQLVFGVCYDICVPSEASYEVTVPAGGKPSLSEALVQALARVPTVAQAVPPGRFEQGSALPNTPHILKTQAVLEGATPKLTMHVAFPNGTAGADVFVEGPPGEFVPLPHNRGAAGDNTLVFEIDFTEGADVAALAGKELRATIVSDVASAEQTFVLK